MAERDHGRGIGDLLGDLGRQVSTLVRREIDLARLEVTSGIARLGRGAGMAGAGGALMYAGLLGLLASAVLGLIEAGMDGWLAALIVAVIAIVIGAVITSMGVGQIQRANMMPTQTAETVRENVQLVKETIK